MTPRQSNAIRLLAGIDRKTRLSVVCVAAVTFIAFLPVLRADWLNWDDEINFVTNENYRGLSGAHIKWMFTSLHFGHYQPLSWLTLAVDYTLWGMNPAGYHLTNLLIHTASAVLFFLVARRLLTAAVGKQARPAGTAIAVAAVFGALVFSIHPLRVENVAWVSERRDVLSGVFLLGSTLAYLDLSLRRVYRSRLILSVGLFALSLLSKSIGVTFPAALLILDVYPLKRLPANPLRWLGEAHRKVILEKLPFVALSGAILATAFLAQSEWIIPVDSRGVGGRLCVIAFAAGFYPRKTVLPLNLLPLYEFPLDFDRFLPYAVASGIGALAVSVVLIILRRRAPYGLAAWAAYLALLFPVSGIVRSGPQLVADRYAYLSCTPFALLAGGALMGVFRRAKEQRTKRSSTRAALVGCAAVVVVLAALTWGQSLVWRDSVTFWTYVLNHNPNSAVARVHMGMACVANGDLPRAIGHLRKAVDVHPRYFKAHHNLGIALAQSGDYAGAAVAFERAASLEPDDIQTRGNLAIVYLNQGDLPAAAEQYRHILRVNPNDGKAHESLALVEYRAGRFEQALERLERARELGADVPPERVKMVRDALNERGAAH